jgi:hypothetical protein
MCYLKEVFIWIKVYSHQRERGNWPIRISEEMRVLGQGKRGNKEGRKLGANL